MTALGFLYPGHSAEDDYPRIEQLLGSDVRLQLVHTDIGEDAHRVDALREMGSAVRLSAGVEELRLSGAEAVVWACTSGSFVYGWEGAHEQVRALARAAGLPASSTSFAFAHAVREVGARRVAIAATYPQDVADLFAAFLREAGVEVVSSRASGIITATEVGTWGEAEVLELARAATTLTRTPSCSPTRPSTRRRTFRPWRRTSPSRSSPPTRSRSGRPYASPTAR